MDGLNVPLTRSDIDVILSGAVLAINVPSAEDPDGPIVAAVFLRLKEPPELKCLTGAPHAAHAWGHKDQYKCPGADVNDLQL